MFIIMLKRFYIECWGVDLKRLLWAPWYK